jgi:type III pantothenate kinase
MANLVIDIGNSFVKAAIFENDSLLKLEHYQSHEITNWEVFIAGYQVSRAIIVSVKKEKAAWESELTGKVPVVYFNRNMAAGIKNHYATPETLGLDRLAAMIAVHYLYPQTNTLVIDAGTCITYDYLDDRGNYFGGSISPGLNMRYEALNHYTSALPLLSADVKFDHESGQDTRGAILSGVQNGITYELTGFIESYRKNCPELNIVLTGGDGIFFDTLLKNSIFAPYIKNEPYLVLKGLNTAIQQHND